MIRSEDGRLASFVYVDVRGRDLASVVGDIQSAVAQQPLPQGVTVSYSGQFEYLERAAERLALVGPATLAIIFLLLFVTFQRVDEALLILASVPFALTGGVWLVYLLGYDLSVAVAVGFIALAGLAAEFGVVMLVYIRNALKERIDRGEHITPAQIADAVREGALLRLRPKVMTVAVVLAGLLPILFTGGTGGEIMRRIAAPMVGGMVTAPLLSLFVIPAAYLMIRRRGGVRKTQTKARTLGKIGVVSLALAACSPKAEEAKSEPAAAMGDMKMENMATPAAPTAAGPILGTGKITALDPAAGFVTLDHGPIPAVQWGPMTMAFTAADPAMLKDLKVGDPVSFELKSAAEKTTIVNIQRQ
jgi:Cu(I)/Ag(I) efflux system membrane protein CusA/SilA